MNFKKCNNCGTSGKALSPSNQLLLIQTGFCISCYENKHKPKPRPNCIKDGKHSDSHMQVIHQCTYEGSYDNISTVIKWCKSCGYIERI